MAMKRKITKSNMRRRFYQLAITVALLFGVLGGNSLVHAMPQNSFAVASSCQPGSSLLPSAIFVPWYAYLEGEGSGKDCHPKFPTSSSGKSDYVKGASLIVLSFIDTIMRLAGLIATGYLLWGAIQYVVSTGDSSGISSAKNTIMNALVGLVIVLVAIGGVQFIGSIATAAPTASALPQVSFVYTVVKALKTVFIITALLSILFVAYGGIRYATSGGSPEGTKQAKATITYALIGLAVAILSSVIVSFILGKLG